MYTHTHTHIRTCTHTHTHMRTLTHTRNMTGSKELFGWDIYSFPKEMDRQGVRGGERGELKAKLILQHFISPSSIPCSSGSIPYQVSEEHWKLTALNGPQYELCPTYPQLLYVPKDVEVLPLLLLLLLLLFLLFLLLLPFFMIYLLSVFLFS